MSALRVRRMFFEFGGRERENARPGKLAIIYSISASRLHDHIVPVFTCASHSRRLMFDSLELPFILSQFEMSTVGKEHDSLSLLTPLVSGECATNPLDALSASQSRSVDIVPESVPWQVHQVLGVMRWYVFIVSYLVSSPSLPVFSCLSLTTLSSFLFVFLSFLSYFPRLLYL